MKKALIFLTIITLLLVFLNGCKKNNKKADEEKLTVQTGTYYLNGNEDDSSELIIINDDLTLEFKNYDFEFYYKILEPGLEDTTTKPEEYKEQLTKRMNSNYNYKPQKREGQKYIDVLDFDGSNSVNIKMKYNEINDECFIVLLEKEFILR